MNPIHPRGARASARPRTVAAVLLLAGALVGTASVLARSASATALSAGRSSASPSAHPAHLMDHLANAGEDTGPGCVESEAAKLP